MTTAENLIAHGGPAVEPTRLERALADLRQGLALRWLWTELALQDIRLRYRGSILGPLWLTVSMLVLATIMGGIYSHLLVTKVPHYVAYLLTGLVLWQFIVAITTEGCAMYVTAQGIIHQVPLPYSVHAYRLICRNFLVLAHNAVVIAAALLFYRVAVDWHVLLVFPALLVLAVNGVWIATLLGMASARFGDIPPIVASLTQVLFFVTPIFWSPDALGRWKTLAEFNPAFAAVDIVRAPLLGVPAEPYSWLVMALTTVLGGGLGLAVFARLRTRIPYWL